MSNKTSDKNVENIEDDVKIVKEFIDYAQGVIDDMEYERPVDVTVYQKDLTSMKHILAEREQMLKERDVANDSVIAHKFAVMQQQLEQKDKRIQELEEEKNACENEIQMHLNTIKEYDKKIKNDYIPKQVVVDELKRLSDMLNRTTEGRIQKYTVNEIIIRSNALQELLEGERK